MRILAIDTALDACSATVFDTELDVPLAIESHEIGRGHAEALLPIVERVMNTAAVGFDTIDRIAATVGPGSFTGLRVGLAAARGFALACNRPAVGITTLAALAAPYIAENDAVPVVSALSTS